MSEAWEIYREDVPQQQEYVVPERWTAEHIMHRMTEAYRTLACFPAFKLKQLAAAWPSHVYEFDDAVGWEDLEPAERADRHADLNRSRRQPDPHEVSMMDEAFGWPGRYLQGEPGIVITRWAERRAKSRHETRQSEPAVIVYRQGGLIAAGLIRDAVAVR